MSFQACESQSVLTGIDGCGQRAISKACIPLGLPGMHSPTFKADLQGHGGSMCPGLLSNESRINMKVSSFANVFANKYGIIVFQTDRA